MSVECRQFTALQMTFSEDRRIRARPENAMPEMKLSRREE
jgi:hypothetical protein